MRYRAPCAHTCADCGCAFMAHDSRQKRCPPCQRAARLACKRASSLRYYYEKVRKPPTDRTCPWCGRTFSSNSLKRVYCSDRCTNLAASARWRRRNGIKSKAERHAPDPTPASAARDWMQQVECDLQIADPTERFKASRAWSARQRAYAQKLALRAIGWRGGAY